LKRILPFDAKIFFFLNKFLCSWSRLIHFFLPIFPVESKRKFLQHLDVGNALSHEGSTESGQQLSTITYYAAPPRRLQVLPYTKCSFLFVGLALEDDIFGLC
jgi:hypothetical protein